MDAMTGSVDGEFKQRVAAFASGAPLPELVGWWLAHLQELADSHIVATRQLEGELALLHAELSVGDRSEDEMCALLAAALSDGSAAYDSQGRRAALTTRTEHNKAPKLPGKRRQAAVQTGR